MLEAIKELSAQPTGMPGLSILVSDFGKLDSCRLDVVMPLGVTGSKLQCEEKGKIALLRMGFLIREGESLLSAGNVPKSQSFMFKGFNTSK